MRVLVAKYWTNFKKEIGKGETRKLVRDGKKFEKLVKKLLDLEYGTDHWVETGETWDGSRDFEWKTRNCYRWAECKNYESKISLNVISNTLVMAMIDFADEILIFSYSNIKKAVLEKLIQFADVSQKILRIYAGDSLEKLILRHITQLKDEFFPDFDIDSSISAKTIYPFVSCNITYDCDTAYTQNSELRYIPQKPDSINFNSILCANINIWNQTATDIIVSVNFDWKQFKGFFRVLPPTKEKMNFTVSSNSTCVKKVYFQPVLYQKVLKLPTIIVSFMDRRIEFPFGKTKCSWIGECTLQGSSYEMVIKNFRNQVLNSKFYKVINICGTSGVGKSRLLKECENCAMGYGYRIIKFSLNSMSKGESILQSLITELICAIYDIPDLSEYIDTQASEIQNATLKMIATLKTKKFDQEYLFNDVIPIIKQKLMQAKCYIYFDNMQFYPHEFISFIYDINQNLLISNAHCKSRMGFSFNTDYIYEQNECISFYTFLVKNKECVVNIKCNGFGTEEETRLFINQLLPNLEIDDSDISKIIAQSNKNPFYIQSYLKLLETEGVLEKRQDCYIIPQHKCLAFKEKIATIPKDIREIIKTRWTYFSNAHYEKQALKIIALLHIFHHLNCEIIQSFQLSPELIDQLCEHYFFKRTSNPDALYLFEHDLTEQFFSEEYFPLCQQAFEMGKLPITWPDFWYTRIVDIIYDHDIILSNLKELVHKNITYKMGYEIYTLLINYVIARMTEQNKISEYLQIGVDVCKIVREMYGTSATLILYEKIIGKVELDFPHYQTTSAWAWLMIAYGNLLYENNRYCDAINSITNLLTYWPEANISNENALIYGYLYNRLHVYNRAINDTVNRNSLFWLEKAESVPQNSELMFINFIDRGYCYYKNNTTKEELISFWAKACDVYENSNILSKKPNYYYAKACVYLFKGNFSQADEIINSGLYALETKEEGTYYFSYFKQRLLICRIALLLFSATYNDLVKATYLIKEVEDINYVLKGRKIFSIHWLKSILFFKKKQFLDAFLCIQTSLTTLIESHKQTFNETYIEQLYSNAQYFALQLKISGNSISAINNLTNKKLISIINQNMQRSISECANLAQKHQATAVLQTMDNKINLPIL